MENLPEPGDRYFTAVLEVINDSINRITSNEEERRFYRSLLAGGNHAAACVVTYCEGLKEIYGEGDASKSLELTKLFTLLMLSQSYLWLGEQNPQATLTTPIHCQSTGNIWGRRRPQYRIIPEYQQAV